MRAPLKKKSKRIVIIMRLVIITLKASLTAFDYFFILDREVLFAETIITSPIATAILKKIPPRTKHMYINILVPIGG